MLAEYAGLPAKTGRLKVTGGKARTQVKHSVLFESTGKCRITVTKGKTKKRLVVTVYSA